MNNFSMEISLQELFEQVIFEFKYMIIFFLTQP